MLIFYQQYMLVHPEIYTADFSSLWSEMKALDIPIVSNISFFRIVPSVDRNSIRHDPVAASFLDRYRTIQRMQELKFIPVWQANSFSFYMKTERV